jgi:cell division protein FtsI (penicillin-binding protein 3)
MTGESAFICNGHYDRVTRGGERITINCLGAHGRVRAREIITFSCNAGAAYASDTLDDGNFYSGLRNLGFGQRANSNSPGETDGYFLPPERWSQRSKPTIAMGQEIAVSAIQMLQAATAIANDGIMISPHYVERVVMPDGTLMEDFKRPEPKQILRAETSRDLRSYMTDVTSMSGTGWRANVDDIKLAVKTGTAQIIDPRTGRYSDHDFIASCIALLPADDPSLVIYLVIYKPGGDSFLGGRIAAPIVREAAEAVVNYAGIPRGLNPQVSHSGYIELSGNLLPEITDTVPDFTGFTKRQILPLILRDDLNFSVKGDGRVARQFPSPGTPISGVQQIILEFE